MSTRPRLPNWLAPLCAIFALMCLAAFQPAPDSSGSGANAASIPVTAYGYDQAVSSDIDGVLVQSTRMLDASILGRNGTTNDCGPAPGGVLETRRPIYNPANDVVHTYYVIPQAPGGTTTGPAVLVHNSNAPDTCPFGAGGVRPPKASSYRATDAGAFPNRDKAWAAATRDKANYKYASPRQECSPTGCHVHLDIYNNRGQLLETRHYSYPKPKGR